MDTHVAKQKLEAERALLTTSLQELGVQDPHNPADWVTSQTLDPVADENDVADHTEAYDTNRAVLSELETRWHEVTAALKRIENGTYGICVVSGEPIEAARLEANPAAATCTAHADTPHTPSA